MNKKRVAFMAALQMLIRFRVLRAVILGLVPRIYRKPLIRTVPRDDPVQPQQILGTSPRMTA
jgi:hypothetical protein